MNGQNLFIQSILAFTEAINYQHFECVYLTDSYNEELPFNPFVIRAFDIL